MGNITKEARQARKFGATVRQMRHDRGITLKVLEKRSGIREAHLSKIERGEIVPLLTTAMSVARGLGLSIDDLIAPP